MKTFALTQATKPHNANRLHDAFIASGIAPIVVESTPEESMFVFADEVTDSAIQTVVTAYSLAVPVAPVDLRNAWQAYKDAVNNATTIPQIKAALTNDLGVLLKELLRSQIGGLP